ncbi:MAG: carboxypeptidase regulatory-like domain-containing protein, partial [Deltaproteobacteria bacterium]|nr:carboxypeptidase regulatory-like domain-containing protein [Deltaproteobacteria bacterium]
MKLNLRNASLFAGLFLFLAEGCSPTVDATNPFDPEAPQDTKAKGTIKGKVDLERASDESGATVTVAETSLTTVTEPTGAFTLTNVPSGVYSVIVTKEGYRQEKLGGVTVKVGQTIDVGEITVAIGRGTVRGAVSLVDATEHAGATITLKEAAAGEAAGIPPVSGKSELRTHDSRLTADDSPPSTQHSSLEGGASFGAVSGSDGSWQISEVPTGQYFLIVAKDGYQAACLGLVTIVSDGEEKSMGVLRLTSASALVRFAKSSGADIVGHEIDGKLVYFANERTLSARFNASGAVQMRASWDEVAIEQQSFESYVVEKDVPLAETEADGFKTLYVDLQDQCGIARRYEAGLTLDMTPPETVFAEIQASEGLDGRRYVVAADGQASVRLAAADVGSGVGEYRLTVDKAPTDEVFNFMPSVGSLVTSLGTEQALHTVYVQYRDRAGNESEVVSSEAILDYEPPVPAQPPVTVRNAIDRAGTPTVYDDFAALDFNIPAGDAAQTALGYASGTGTYETFNAGATLGLLGRDRGEIRLYVKFRDNARNETAEYEVAFFRETQGSISGSVVLENVGAPAAPQVSVGVEGLPGLDATADAQGAYTIASVPAGARVLRFSADGYVSVTAPVVVLASPDPTTVAAVALAAARGGVRGTVSIDGGGGAPGAQVTLRGTAKLGTVVAAGTVAGEDGRFEIGGLLAGTDYDLGAALEGYKLKSGARVDVKEGAVTDGVALVIELNPGSIKGRVSLEGGADPAGVTVQVSTVGTPVVPDSNGDYTVTGLARGTYALRFTAQGYDGAQMLAVVRAGEEVEVPEIALKRSRGALAGVFTLAGTSNHAGIAVRIAEPGITVETAADGAFSVANLVVGQYAISASKHGYLGIGGQAVTVPAGGTGTAAGGELQVSLAGSISGTVACDVGTCAGVAVNLSGTRFDGQAVTAATAANGAGAYALAGLPGGDYVLAAQKNGYDGAQTSVSLAPGAARQAPAMTLFAQRGSVSGTVTVGGVPTQGALVTLSGTSTVGIAVNQSVTSGPGGLFKFEGVLIGSYTLTTTLPDHNPVTGSVAVAADVETPAGTIALTMNPGSITGSAALEGGGDPTVITVTADGAGGVHPGANGSYALAGLAAGTHTVAAEAAGYYTTSATVVAKAGQTVTAPNLTLLRARGKVQGLVEVAGAPTNEGALVTVFKGAQRFSTTTAASGAFEIAGIPSDSGYDLTVEKEGYLTKHLLGLAVVADQTTDAGTIVIDRITGDFAFMHCLHYTTGDKQYLSLVGLAYLGECGSVSGPGVRLDLVPPGGTTKIQWALMQDFSDATEVTWDPDDPPLAYLGSTSGTVKVNVKYYVPTNNPPWTDPYSADIFVDREAPLIDSITILNNPFYLTPALTYMYFSVRAHDPLSGSEDGSGVKKYAFAIGAASCPADGTAYLVLPGDIVAGVELSVQVITAPGSESEGTKTARLCLRDAAGNLVVSANQDITFDKTSPVAQTFAFFADRGDAVSVTLVNNRNIVLKAAVQTMYAPLTGVAFASQAFDCYTATYETPDIVSVVVTGDRRDYVISKAWTLSGNDGDKKAHVCLKDWAGNITGSSFETNPYVRLDTTPPDQCGIVLQGGALAVNVRDLTLALNSSDPAGDVFVSGDVDPASPFPVNTWTAFIASPPNPLRISTGNGIKTVTVKCSDEAGNVSQVGFTTVILDTIAPSGSIVIAGGAAYTQSNTVSLGISGVDERTGVASMKFANEAPPDCASAPGWVAYSTTYNNWNMVNSEGTRTVTACLKDGAGNTAVITPDSIFLDLNNPLGTVSINGGDAYTGSLDVVLTLTASADVAQIKVSNGPLACGSVTDWVAYQPLVQHALNCSSGETCNVNVCLRDASGRVSGTLSDPDGIAFDNREPAVASFAIAGGDWANTADVTLSMAVTDDLAIEMRISGDVAAVQGGLPNEWMAYAASQVVTLSGADGLKTVTIQFRDAAGNLTPPFSDSLNLDRAAPAGTVSINNGDAKTNSAIVTLSLPAAQDTLSMFVANGVIADCAAVAPGDFVDYAAVKVWTLSAGADGSREVNACFRDRAGNVSTAVAGDDIMLDTTPPGTDATSLVISQGAYTQVRPIDLSLHTTDADQTGYAMYIDGDVEIQPGVTHEWVPYATAAAVTLTAPQGLKQVRVRFRDEVGNIGALAADTITYDSLSPDVPRLLIVQGGVTKDDVVDLSLYAGGAATMCVFGNVKFAGDPGFRTVADPAQAADPGKECETNGWWEPYAQSKDDATIEIANADNTAYVYFRDDALNLTPFLSAAIYWDTTLPSVAAGDAEIKGVIADDQPSDLLSGTMNVVLTWTVSGAGGLAGGVFDANLPPVEMGFANVACAAPATDCASVGYIPYVPEKGWVLDVGTSPNGVPRCVDYCFRDQAGNVSDAQRGGILLDLVAPTVPTISVSAGDYSSSRDIDVVLNASGADEYYIEGNVLNDANTFEWLSGVFPATVPVDLPAGDGSKVVMARFRDLAGNESAAAIDTVWLDETPPVAALSVNAGAAYTRTAAVSLVITASPDVVEMAVGDDDGVQIDCATAVYQAFASPHTYLLSSPTVGEETVVKVCVRDRAGLSAPATDGIVFDNAPPTGAAVTIAGWRKDPAGGVDIEDAGVSYTNNVKLTLNANDATKAALSIDPTFDCLTASYFNVTFVAGTAVVNSYLLGSGTGLKTVYACYADDAGNVTASKVNDQIYLDQTPPAGVAFQIDGGAVYNQDSTVDLTGITASDDYAGQLMMKLSNCADFGGGAGCNTTGWTNLNPPATNPNWDLIAGAGLKNVYLSVRDYSGNVAVTAGDSITVDLDNPDMPATIFGPGRISVVDGTRYVASTTPVVRWSKSPAADLDRYEVRLRTPPGAGVWTTYVKVPEGFDVESLVLPVLTEVQYEWQVRAVDAAGRQSDWAAVPAVDSVFTVDVTPPSTPRFENVAQTVRDLAAGADCTNDNVLTLGLAVLSTDTNMEGYEIRGGHKPAGALPACTPKNDFTYEGAAPPFTFYLNADQANNLQVRAMDRAGNYSSADFVFITEDSTVPA